jgi:hypothetical protein
VANIDRHRTEAARAREAIGAPFPDAEALTTARDRVAGLKTELDELAAPRPEYNPIPAKETIEGALGVHGFIDADNVVTFVLADGRTGTVAPGPDDQHPYQVRIIDMDGNAPAQTDTVLAEVPDAIRLLAGDPDLPESTAATLRARTHPVKLDAAQPVDGPSDAQFAAVALASVSMPSTMSQRLGARGGTSKTPRQQPPQPPRTMPPETER